MLIIIEGPDGAGKSTLAGKLAAHLTVRGDTTTIMRRGAPVHHPIDEYLRALTEYRPGTNDHLVLDRWHWGEHVYPQIRGRETQLDAAIWWSIEAYLQRLGALVIKCDSSRESYDLTFADRPETDMWQLNELAEVQAAFREAWRRSQLQCVGYDWRYAGASAKLQVTDYVQLAANRERHAAELNQFTTYLGPRYPKVLLLGDVRHGFNLDLTCCGTNSDPYDPAFLPFKATSGHYLLSALTTADFTEFGLANACDVDDPIELWKTLDSPHVVALGRNACRKLDQLNVPHGSVPHPQYVRRFHHKQIQRYADDIVKAAHEQRRIDWPSSFPVLTVATSTRMSSTTSGPTEPKSSPATESFTTSTT